MAKRNAAAPNQDAAAADSFSPRVPASTVPSNIPADSTRNARHAYCRLMSEPVNPMARSTAMEYRSFAVSIFMNNNVTSNTMTAETRPAMTAGSLQRSAPCIGQSLKLLHRKSGPHTP